jgi:hypothetical protein
VVRIERGDGGAFLCHLAVDGYQTVRRSTCEGRVEGPGRIGVFHVSLDPDDMFFDAPPATPAVGARLFAFERADGGEIRFSWDVRGPIPAVDDAQALTGHRFGG